MCLLLWLSLQPHFLINERLLFRHQTCTLFLLSLHPWFSPSIHISSLAFGLKWSSSSACRLASRARGTASPTLSRAHLFSSGLSLAYSDIWSSSSDFKFADPLTQSSTLPLQSLDLNHLPLHSVLLQGQGIPLLLSSVACFGAPLLPALRIWKVVPSILPSNVPAPLAHILALPL